MTNSSRLPRWLRRLRRKLCAICFGHVVYCAVAAQLQHTNVSSDAPPIAYVHTIRIAIHAAKAVGHHAKEVADRHLSQPIRVKRRRMRESALNDHAIAAAGIIVAGRAINVVALAPALQVCARDREREARGLSTILAAGEK